MPLDLYLLEVSERPDGAPQLRQNWADIGITEAALECRRTVAVRDRRYVLVALAASAGGRDAREQANASTRGEPARRLSTWM